MSDKNAYSERMRAVVDYIDEHLDEALTLDRLSRVANFSKFHFHRQFRHYIGVTVFELIQLKRLTRASYRLFIEEDTRITDIALAAGFENSESFSRAFKKAFQQTPSQFRQQPFLKPWLDKTNFPRLGAVKPMQVNIVDFPETKIALMIHRGSPETEMQSVRKFIRWRKEHGYHPDKSATYNIFYDDPTTTAPEDYRFGLGAGVEDDIEDNTYGVVNSVILAGRCAVLRQIGSPNNLDATFQHLYHEWLPNSGEELRDFPCFIERVTLAGFVPDKDVIIDMYLPLK